MKKVQNSLNEKTYKYLKVESRRRTEINQFKKSLIKAINETSGIWQYKVENVEETIRKHKERKQI